MLHAGGLLVERADLGRGGCHHRQDVIDRSGGHGECERGAHDRHPMIAFASLGFADQALAQGSKLAIAWRSQRLTTLADLSRARGRQIRWWRAMIANARHQSRYSPAVEPRDQRRYNDRDSDCFQNAEQVIENTGNTVDRRGIEVSGERARPIQVHRADPVGKETERAGVAVKLLAEPGAALIHVPISELEHQIRTIARLSARPSSAINGWPRGSRWDGGG